MKASAGSIPSGKSASQRIDAIIRKSDDWRGNRLSQLRVLVKNTDAVIIEEVKWKKPSRPEGVPVWSADGVICLGEMLKNAVRITFPKGALIKDPKKLFNTRLTSASVRAIDFHENDSIDDAALKSMIRAAVSLNQSKKI